jgi:hypothetical protein
MTRAVLIPASAPAVVAVPDDLVARGRAMQVRLRAAVAATRENVLDATSIRQRDALETRERYLSGLVAEINRAADTLTDHRPRLARLVALHDAEVRALAALRGELAVVERRIERHYSARDAEREGKPFEASAIVPWQTSDKLDRRAGGLRETIAVLETGAEFDGFYRVPDPRSVLGSALLGAGVEDLSTWRILPRLAAQMADERAVVESATSRLTELLADAGAALDTTV